jgi:SAM-dependent methyltransferase
MDSKEKAKKMPKGDIKLALCQSCGFITNILFQNNLIDYTLNYESQQAYSPTFMKYLDDLTNYLIKKYDLYEKKITDIGCGKGDFLYLISKIGNNIGVGIDPAYIGRDQTESTSKNISFILEYLSEDHKEYFGDFISCRHTLEHISNVSDFIHLIRKIINDQLNTIVFFEVPDVTRILNESAFWDIYYEHPSYFTPRSLGKLFLLNSFDILDINIVYDNQYILLESKPVNVKEMKIYPKEENIDDFINSVNLFKDEVKQKIIYYKSQVDRFIENEEKIVIWGSGSKCVSFMTTLDIAECIEYVIDINPFRWDKFLPTTGTEIKSPKYLQEYNPDSVIIMNHIYENEIKNMLSEMGLQPKLVSMK